MASKYDPIRGLHVKTGFFKSVLKGEDAWLQKPGIQPVVKEADCSMDIFGIFDGHGGKQAAIHSSKHILDHLKSAISKCINIDVNEERISEELQNCTAINEDLWKYWRGQNKLASCLPGAYVECFKSLQDAIFEQMKESGTTGTVISLIGWELIVANVGDSCAYLDTGNEVLQVSGNHRLDDNKKEQKRIRDEGFELSSSKIEGRATGPLRVWPGGLAMGRTLGDFSAGDIVTCEPEVRQLCMPEQGGRIVVASDGLWDAVTPKTALHHIRGMPASKAGRELVQMAVKGRDLKDDITVLVIDAMPSSDHKLPPLLSKDGAGKLHSVYMNVDPVNVYHPLEDGDVGQEALHRLFWSRRLAAVRNTFLEWFQSPESMEDLLSESLTETHLDNGEEVLHSRDSEFNGSPMSQQLEYNNMEAEDDAGWETVPEKTKAMPMRSRKHALHAGEGSPENYQAPKVMKEAPPSPAPNSMQTSDIGSSRGSFSGRFRGRGRGRGGGRGRGRVFREVQAARQQVEGFEAPMQESQGQSAFPYNPDHHIHVECSAPDGFSFLAGGGFGFQPSDSQSAHSVPPGFEPLDELHTAESNLLRGSSRERAKKPNGRKYWQGRRGSRGGRRSFNVSAGHDGNQQAQFQQA